MRGWPPRAQCHNNIIQNRTRAAQVKILRDTHQLDSGAHAAACASLGSPAAGICAAVPLERWHCSASLDPRGAGAIALRIRCGGRVPRDSAVCGVARRMYGPGRHSRGLGLGRAGRGKKKVAHGFNEFVKATSRHRSPAPKVTALQEQVRGYRLRPGNLSWACGRRHGRRREDCHWGPSCCDRPCSWQRGCRSR